MKPPCDKPNLSSLLQDFFCQRLINQRNASPRTIAAYRDTFRLFIRYLADKRNLPPETLCLAILEAPMILAFLNYLEKDRHNSIRSRNARLAAIRSFAKYVALRVPTALFIIQQTLAIPMKRYSRPLVGYLTPEETQAILNAPPATTWSGRRDRAMLALMYNTGARVSEIVSLRPTDVDLTTTLAVKIQGKGRKQRMVPLWKTTARQLRQWLKEIDSDPVSPLFPNAYGQALTRSGVESRLKSAVKGAMSHCSTLKNRQISPHALRHTTAMHLLQAGVDLTVIALWLGHESPATTHMYLDADITMKEKALQCLHEPTLSPLRYQPTGKLLQFLEGL